MSVSDDTRDMFIDIANRICEREGGVFCSLGRAAAEAARVWLEHNRQAPAETSEHREPECVP